MFIRKIKIHNYKCFDEIFVLDFSEGNNILVGLNEAGKSTILEAINLALSGLLNGRYIKNELTQYLFNVKVVEEYLTKVRKGENVIPPEISIEIFFGGERYAKFEGDFNSEKDRNASGFKFMIEFDHDFDEEYGECIGNKDGITTLPIEFYKTTWISFAREPISIRSIPIKSAYIDSSSNKFNNGSDVYISKIIDNYLSNKEKVQLSQVYRLMKDSFTKDSTVVELNEKLKMDKAVTKKEVSISVDLSVANSWEGALLTYLDKIPFHQIGMGEQCLIKTNLSLLYNKKNQEAQIILLEEPENHLTHSKLNELLQMISDSNKDKQIIVTTHSSFVANKLGLKDLILLNQHLPMRLSNLSAETLDFFKKLPGYQTLRLILSKKTILVEGDSDELIFQKAYSITHSGVLPIENGIDVISVKLTFLRFLEIAAKIRQPVAVITDNDGDYKNKIEKKYSEYFDKPFIKIFADENDKLETLEPQFLAANSDNIISLLDVLGLDHSSSKEEILSYMENNKTTWALKIFDSSFVFAYPEYIMNAVRWCNEE